MLVISLLYPRYQIIRIYLKSSKGICIRSKVVVLRMCFSRMPLEPLSIIEFHVTVLAFEFIQSLIILPSEQNHMTDRYLTMQYNFINLVYSTFIKRFGNSTS